MPGRVKMGTTGEQHQEGGRRRLVKHETKQFQGRRIGPVEVFYNEQHRVLFGLFQEDRDKSFQRFVSLPLRGYIERRVTIFRYRKRQQRRKQWYGFLQGQSILAERCSSLPNFSSGVSSGWNWNSRWNKSVRGKSAVF